MSVDRLPSLRRTEELGITRLEAGDVGYTPEGLIKRVYIALDKFGLTGVEGEVFGKAFNLRKSETGFELQSPPVKEDGFIGSEFTPDIYAQVSMPSEFSPEGTIAWLDVSKYIHAYDEFVNSNRDEIVKGQKVALILDQLLKQIEEK